MKAGGFSDVEPRFEADALEQEVLRFWEQDGTFEKSLARRQAEGAKPFVFYDGPPYATGKPHYGHVLQSAIKDAVLRYKTMRGYWVPRRVGWDTHGLPVEVLVEKELGLKTKKDVEQYGIEQFNQKCREAVFRYIDVFRQTLQRLGRWADYGNEYATLDRTYMESEWWVFQQLWEKGLVYKDFRSTPYCVRCATPLSNFEVSMAYKERTDRSVYVKLKVLDLSRKAADAATGLHKQLSLLVWTTTPWTLPANVAVAVSKDLAYVSVQSEGEEYIIARDRAKAVFGEDAKIVKEWEWDELLELTYEPLYEGQSEIRNQTSKMYRVVAAAHVTAEDGTGLVHMAPAFGAEDYEVGKREGLPTVRTVDGDGRYTVAPWVGKSLWDVNGEVIADLTQRGLLFKEEPYTHSYPHCWRCDQPLIYYALDSWFVKVVDLKDRLLEANEQIQWIPEHVKHGRFAKGIESAPDWAVSRNRFWSTPIPVWECERCQARVCVGSAAELSTYSGVRDIPDLHRPYVDELTWSHECGGTMRRIPEVLDVWFDSGSMPYSQWHYPFENKEFVENSFPADFIAESIEMTRAWFYTLHVLAVALKGKPAYKTVIGSGIIFGSDGNKLSKKLKNYPEIEPTLEKYGADTLRMFFLASTLGEPYVFSEKELQQLYRNFTMRLWNVYAFFVQYANTQNWTKKKSQIANPKSQKILDHWILARLKQLELDVISAAEAYRFDAAARMFIPFVDELSNWYVRRSRERFQPKGEPDAAAFHTLHEVLMRLSKLLAPFMPFLTERLYRNLGGEESVHLQTLSDAPAVSPEEARVLADMTRAREAASAGLALRAKAGIKVRQPLQRLVVPGEELASEIVALLADEVNVKEVMFDAQASEISLDTTITEELRQEGLAREIIRRGQQLRRQAGYDLGDRIQLIWVTQGATMAQVFERQREVIMRALQADEVLLDTAGEDAGDDFSLGGETVHVGVRRGKS